MSLSLRLQTIYDLCLPGLPLWDLCCDHGQLGLWALHSGDHPLVVFNDAVAHVLEPIAAKFGSSHERARIVCSPAEEIAEPLRGSVVLAGIGGEKIVHILQAHAERGTLQASRLVVCPEKDAEWMMAQPIPGFTLASRLNIPHSTGHRWIAVYEPSASSV